MAFERAGFEVAALNWLRIDEKQKARQASTWRASSLRLDRAYLPNFKKSSPLPNSSIPALE